MVNVGLTGGIGSGKSTVARRLSELGAVVIDADAIARDVLRRGGDPLARVAERFGADVLTPEGDLDRAALAGRVFGDEAARRDLEAITHPVIAARTAERVAAAPDGAVVVHDVPLLVEKQMGSRYHLVVVVEASVPTRLRRLASRGMSETDARARMEHQASDAARRAAADVVLDNEGGEAALTAQIDALWRDRLAPFARNLTAQTRARRPETPHLVPYDDTWPAQADRLIARIGAHLGARAPQIEHIGSTAVPAMIAKDVIDLQIGVPDLHLADDPEFVDILARLGFPRSEGNTLDHVKEGVPDPSAWVKRFHGSCDPGRIVHLHVRELESAGWQYALLFRDWLRSDHAAFEDYRTEKRRLAQWCDTTSEYADAKEPWFSQAWPRMQDWARRTGWHD